MANVYGLIFEVEDKTGRGTRSISGNLKKIQNNADKAKAALRGVGSIAGSAVGALGKVAAAATAAAAAFGFLAKRNLDALDNLGKTASKLGVSTKFLSEYSFVANQAGISTDQFNTGLQRFLRRLGQAQMGTGELLKPLQQLGISMTDANGNFRDGTEVFQEFLTKLDGTASETQKLALAMGAFDTEGVDFVNIASMGADEIARLRAEVVRAGGSIDERLTKAAAKANDALGKLVLTGKSFLANFFGELAPAIESLATDINEALLKAVEGAGGMEAFARQLADDFIAGTQAFILTLGELFDGFTNGLATATNALKRILASIPSSLTGGVEYTLDANPVPALKARRDEVRKELKGIADELGIELEDMFNRYGGVGSFDALLKSITNPTLHSQAMALNKEFGDLAQQIGNIEAGRVVFLELGEEASNVGRTLAEEVNVRLQEVRDRIREVGEGKVDIEALAEAAIKAAEAQAALNQELLLAPAKAAFAEAESIQKTLEQADAYGQLEKRAVTLQNHIYELNRSFSNGALRMGVGWQATMDYAEAQRILGLELSKVREEMAKMLRQQEYLSKPELEFIDRHAEMTAELEKTELALIRTRAEMALAAGDTSAYEYAIRKLTERQAELNAELTGNKPDKPKTTSSGISEIKTLSQLNSALAQDSEKLALKIGIFSQYMASGSRSAKEIEDAMNKLGITMDDLPYDQFVDTFESLHKSGKPAMNNYQRLQAELNKLIKDGVTLSEQQQRMLDSLNEQLGTETFDVIGTLEDRLGSLAISTADTFTDVILGLKNGFEALEDIALQVLRTIISTLIEATIRRAILGQTLNMGGGSGVGMLGGLLGGLGSLGMGTLIPGLGLLAGIGGLLGGFFADGGSTARAGQKPIVVGERGPEIFLPGKAGTVVSNEDLNSMGGQGDLNVSFTINAIDTQTGVQFLLENKRVITGVIQEAYMRRGTSGPLG